MNTECEVDGEPTEPESYPYCPACAKRTPAQRVAHAARLLLARTIEADRCG